LTIPLSCFSSFTAILLTCCGGSLAGWIVFTAGAKLALSGFMSGLPMFIFSVKNGFSLILTASRRPVTKVLLLMTVTLLFT
jgi:hypothetical protein